MKYFDRIYGFETIEDLAVLDLIQSPSMQRLRAIDQGGYRPHWIHPDIDCSPEDHSRFAHSLGVFLLLRKYGAPLEEQIAGLLHDISHSAFSHCIDYVLDSGDQKTQSHQDAIFERYLKESEIPDILRKHGIDPLYILDDSHFPLKEKNLPDLCADRIDYSLRTAVIFKEISAADAIDFLNGLIARDNTWFFTSFEQARRFAELFSFINKKHYSGFSSAVMFDSVGGCLKYAHTKGYITTEDLYTTDKEVLGKLQIHVQEDPWLNVLWLRMNNKIKASHSENGNGKEVFCKSRIVDPLFLGQQGLLRVSDADPSWKKILREECVPKRYVLAYE
jgi:uncharacterized protein